MSYIQRVSLYDQLNEMVERDPKRYLEESYKLNGVSSGTKSLNEIYSIARKVNEKVWEKATKAAENTYTFSAFPVLPGAGVSGPEMKPE